MWAVFGIGNARFSMSSSQLWELVYFQWLRFDIRLPCGLALATFKDGELCRARPIAVSGIDATRAKPIQSGILRAEIDHLNQTNVTHEDSNMNKANGSPEGASVNLNELLARVDNDRGLLCDLLSIFKREFPIHLTSLQNAVAGNDAVQAARVSHTLKGMLANLAATKATASASRLERLAREGEISALGDALAAFEKEVQGLLPEMESYMAEARP